MILAGIHAEATGAFYTMISGDRQDLKKKLARVQDNADELLALIKENVTDALRFHHEHRKGSGNERLR